MATSLDEERKVSSPIHLEDLQQSKSNVENGTEELQFDRKLERKTVTKLDFLLVPMVSANGSISLQQKERLANLYPFPHIDVRSLLACLP